MPPLVILALLAAAMTAPPPAGDEAKQVAAVLAKLHAAASAADGQRYFALFAPGAVFLGTDADERWPLEAFRAYAAARFEKGDGWTYVVRQRHVTVADGGRTAWFDERLHNDRYGECRGTGVLVNRPDGWRIAQYNLTIPVPNAIAPDVVRMIREAEAGDR